MMRSCFILITWLLAFCATAQKPGSKYVSMRDGKEGNAAMTLTSNGTFTMKEFGGCDGILEARGTWKVSKDTLIVVDLEHRMMNDPWKKSEGELRYLIKKDSLIAFSLVEGKLISDENEYFKRRKK